MNLRPRSGKVLRSKRRADANALRSDGALPDCRRRTAASARPYSCKQVQKAHSSTIIIIVQRLRSQVPSEASNR